MNSERHRGPSLLLGAGLLLLLATVTAWVHRPTGLRRACLPKVKLLMWFPGVNGTWRMRSADPSGVLQAARAPRTRTCVEVPW
jgi:hypothetical protein